MLADLVEVDGSVVPAPVAHLARDPLDPRFDADAVVKVLRRQAFRAQARSCWTRPWSPGSATSTPMRRCGGPRSMARGSAATLSRRQLAAVLDAAADVMSEALAKGGTSFDSLYVNVNGESGYFDRSLDAYGREGESCRRCGAVIRREQFMNRSSFYCPRCQPRPRS